MADQARLDAEAKLEPAAVGFSTNDEERVALSIAISLKRIADVGEKIANVDGVNPHLFNSFIDMMWQAGQAFERGKGTA